LVLVMLSRSLKRKRIEFKILQTIGTVIRIYWLSIFNYWTVFCGLVSLMSKFSVQNISHYIYIICFLSVIPIYAAKADAISGYIRDSETGENLPGVSIFLVNSNFGASSDYRGRFVIRDIPDDIRDIKLRIHLIGYEEEFVELGQIDDLSSIEILLTPSPWKMDNVVVTGTRRNYILKDVPVTTELITAEEFKKTGALTVDEALDSHIGVTITDDLSGKGISLRGVDPSRVLILIDGNRVIGRVQGSLDIGQLPLANVKQIEIIKGTGSTLYGSDAIGGVVNIITRKPPALTNLNLYGSYGSFNSSDIQADISSSLMGNGINFTTKYEHTDGFDLDKTTEHTNGLENIDRFNINNKTIIGISPGWDIEIAPGFMAESKYWIETQQIGSAIKINFDDYEYNYRYDLSLRSKTNLKDKADLTLGLNGSLYDHTWEKHSRAGIFIDTSITRDDIVEFSLLYHRALAGGHILTFGGDISTQGLKSDQLESGEERIYQEDIYAQYEWRPVSKIVLLPGARLEHHKTYGNHFNPSFNIMWDACSYFNLRGSVSRGFRAPSIKELYFEFDHSAEGYKVIGGGEHLRPETSDNYSITAEINYNKKAIHRLSYFKNDLNDLIEFVEIDPSDYDNPADTSIYYRGIYRYDNILKAKTEGIEWETEIRILDKLDLSFSYTYLLAKNLSDTSSIDSTSSDDSEPDLINRPRHTFKFNTGYLVKPIGVNLNFWGYWHDRKLWSSRGDTPELTSDNYAPSRWNLNIGLGKTIFSNFDLLFKVENITNETNVNYNYWPERSYNLGVTFNFEKGR